MVFTLKVTAPATLEEGYSFDATADGRTFRVKVPEGGVQAGEEFVVHDSHEIIVATRQVSSPDEDAPLRGHWRKSFFACFDTLFTATFWMAFCCPAIQVAQLMTRFNLDWISRDASPEVVRRTFVASMIVLLVFWSFLGWLPEILFVYFLFYIFIQTRLRRKARIRYGIPGNVFVDLIRTLFCSCCSSIQMVRQTHDEKEYPYEALAVDGLPMWAKPLESETTASTVGGEAPQSATEEVDEVVVHATVV